MISITNSKPVQVQAEIFGAINDRTMAALRLLLATLALLIIYLDPSEPDRYVAITYTAVITYMAYSGLIYLVARLVEGFSPVLLHSVTWTDVAWYSFLIALSSGTNSLFFLFYFFAIIAASSRGGKKLGLAVTFVSAFLFTVVGLYSNVSSQVSLNLFLVRPTGLMALGYTLACWGGAEIALKQRMALLKDMSFLSNPRFGVNRTIGRVLQNLLKFYHADRCFFVLGDTATHFQVHHATRRDPEGGAAATYFEKPTDIPPFRLSDPYPTVYNGGASWFPFSRPIYRGCDSKAQKVIDLPTETATVVAQFFAGRSFIAAPLRIREKIQGRIIVSSARSRCFDISDATFLMQAGEQILPAIENIRLVDRLASEAAEQERRKIARSLHDRVIQPYLGLRIGLSAVYQVLQSEEGSESSQRNGGESLALLSQLMAMTSEGIEELRQYVYGLKNSQGGETSLIDSIRRFAGKFESVAGVRIEVVDRLGKLPLNDRLAAEIFQMTAEALSNVHRHTTAQHARVTLDLRDNNLVLQVENETDEDATPAKFRPVSISERADALGGRSEVSLAEDRTVVKVEVPL